MLTWRRGKDAKKVRPRKSHWMYQDRTEVARVTEDLVPLKMLGKKKIKMQGSERAVWKEDFEFILLDSLPVASRVFGS